jgi:hypothetical protein
MGRLHAIMNKCRVAGCVTDRLMRYSSIGEELSSSTVYKQEPHHVRKSNAAGTTPNLLTGDRSFASDVHGDPHLWLQQNPVSTALSPHT